MPGNVQLRAILEQFEQLKQFQKGSGQTLGEIPQAQQILNTLQTMQQAG